MRKKYDGDIINISEAKERIVAVDLTKDYLKKRRELESIYSSTF